MRSLSFSVRAKWVCPQSSRRASAPHSHRQMTKPPKTSLGGFLSTTGSPRFASNFEWLPTSGYGANFSTVLFLDGTKRKKEVRPARKPRLLELLEQAESFHGMLATGEAKSRSHLASAFGLSRPRVTQIMNLLTLHPDILTAIRRMPLNALGRWITEKQLRPLVQMGQEELGRQMAAYLPRTLLERREAG
jgi:hypothetical protein